MTSPAPTHYPEDGRYALREHKTVKPLVGSALKIWLTRPAVFVVAALAVVVPLEVIFTGILGGGFTDPEGLASPGWGAVDGLLVGFFGAALITAAHARAVVALAAGQQVGTFSALRLGKGAWVPVLGATLLYGIAVFAGLIVLILPGIFISVAFLFGPQVAALTKTGISTSLSSSYALVKSAGWWRTLGYWLLIALVSFGAVLVVAVPIVAVSELVDDPSVSGPIAVLLNAIATAFVYSFTALAQSLLYFSLRAKVGEPWATEIPAGAPDLEAGPDWRPTAEPAATASH